MHRKTLKELTLKDNFMFGAVMSIEENCIPFLELVLQFPIEHVEISKERSMIYHPEYSGIRLDIFARDENNTRYNVEMQALNRPGIGKRARYYHSQIDMELLHSSMDYTTLPNSYVIFICDFDPFHEAKYCYTFERRCLEVQGLSLEDGCRTIFLSTRGENPQDVSESMVKFLDYVRADLNESQKDFEDDYVRMLQTSVSRIKADRDMEENFMLLELLLRDERVDGRAEGRAEGMAEGMARGRAEGKAEGKAEGRNEGRAVSILEILQELGNVSEDLKNRILVETDTSTLTAWLKLAAKAESVEQFMEKM